MTADKAGGVYVTGAFLQRRVKLECFGFCYGQICETCATCRFLVLLVRTPITFTAFDRFGNSPPAPAVINVLAGPPSVVAPDDYTSVARNNGLNTLVAHRCGSNLPDAIHTGCYGRIAAGARIHGTGLSVGQECGGKLSISHDSDLVRLRSKTGSGGQSHKHYGVIQHHEGSEWNSDWQPSG